MKFRRARFTLLYTKSALYACVSLGLGFMLIGFFMFFHAMLGNPNILPILHEHATEFTIVLHLALSYPTAAGFISCLVGIIFLCLCQITRQTNITVTNKDVLGQIEAKMSSIVERGLSQIAITTKDGIKHISDARMIEEELKTLTASAHKLYTTVRLAETDLTEVIDPKRVIQVHAAMVTLQQQQDDAIQSLRDAKEVLGDISKTITDYQLLGDELDAERTYLQEKMQQVLALAEAGGVDLLEAPQEETAEADDLDVVRPLRPSGALPGE